MKYFKNYRGEDLTNYVINSIDVSSILIDEEFLDYILEPENHYAFVWLVDGLKDDSKLSNAFLTTKFLDRILLDERARDKYNAIISYNPSILEKASDKVIEFLVNTKDLYFIYTRLNLIVANKMLDYIIHNDNDKVSVLSALSSSVQIGLFNPTNMEKILNLKSLQDCYLKFCPEVIIKLFEQKKYRDLILNLSKEKLNNLSIKFQNYEMPNWVQNNKELVKLIANIENPSYYRSIIRNFTPNNYNLVLNLEKERNCYVDNLIASLNSEGIFKEYIDLRNYIEKNGIDRKIYNCLPEELHICDLNDSKLRQITIKRLFENICDLFFKDYPKNVLLNIKQVINFINESRESVIPVERENIYRLILYFNTLSLSDIKALYKSLSSFDDISSLLYDDVRNCKNKSYEIFNNEFLKIKESDKLLSKELSEEVGCNVYKLDGEDFVACVHVGHVSKDFPRKTMSLSVIGTECIGTFYKDDIIVGFEYLDPNKIMHMYSADSYTSNQYGSSRVNEIYTPKSLLKSTNYFNEVLYSEMDNKVLFPNYVVCKDEIDDNSINYAKDNNLPIVLINTKKYSINNASDKEEKYQSYASESLEEDYFGKKI